ncbi:MAG: LysM domain-containing protein [Terrimicrobiaceae bacterium]|nr:LysM domain-containing protein [Terrimicrobiaceae bacterium]
MILPPVRSIACPSWRWILALALSFALPACDQFSLPAAKAKVEEQAAEAQKSGDYPRAVRLYESLLDGTAATAKIHYSLALLYDDKLKDPISALHHFRRYMRMSGDEASKKEVARFIQRIELEIAAGNADSGIMTKREAARLKNENLKLQEQITRLQADLADARRKSSAKDGTKTARDPKGFSTNPATAAAEKSVGRETRTYTVQKGDTLASIARRFYKNAQRYKDIADANQNQLNGTVDLKVGQTLIIPQ